MARKYKRRKKADHDDNLVFADENETFFEVETVLERRVKNDEVEYLVKWKGCPKSQSTWEPSDNLCDSALVEAREFDRVWKDRNSAICKDMLLTSEGLAENLQQCMDDGSQMTESVVLGFQTEIEAQQEGDAVLGCQTELEAQQEDDALALDKKPAASKIKIPPLPPPPLEDGRWRWTDDEQINFREPERINVNDSDAKQRVTDARLNGTPIVLVGHVGWANFAKKWLTPVDNESMEAGQMTGGYKGESEWLDLSREYNLDIQKMIEDIGNELVPVVNKDYNEHKPLQAKMKASAFLKTCWPDTEGRYSSDDRLYLHQWQFPLSETAGRIMCHQNRRFPNEILGEDLLKYWLDLRQCKMDSALQYLFMGRDETMSKLHRDNGGLAISIAPIVGVKECVLVHRSDGATCFYHLDASVDDIDLHRYPLMAKARIWKTSIKPGEILLMPQGTYHQCRNLTPCLSYSRFHLDTVNLLPFLQSMVDGDAQEIAHGEIIWNSSNEVMNAIDSFVEECRLCVKADPMRPCPVLSDEIIEKVETLRSLRHICRETARRLGAQKVKRQRNENTGASIGKRADWVKIVDDIDDSLHHFRHRESLKIPSRSRKRNATTEAPTEEDRDVSPFGVGSERIDGNGDFASSMETALASLEERSPFRSKMRKPGEEEIQTADHVVVRFQKREALGTIIGIEQRMNAAYLSYEGFPSIYDEYQPYEKLRISVGGERSVEVGPRKVKEGALVLNRWGDTGEEYRALVVSTCCRRFFSVRLHLSPTYHLDRWFPIDAIASWANLEAGDES